ncbi:MAG: hypothetical protein EOP46_21505 [Sphingobacteriaceae bacterium]|nr:MAG: hypothetical protein EOP46_21505 [Sphingobacteriaceae bacterium]
MKQMKTAWVDTAIADAKTLTPIYHSSFNGQRDMVLHFAMPVTGYYFDKMKKSSLPINDTVSRPFFDSNLYPNIIAWLPLKVGYTAILPIYDYSPDKKGRLLKASIKGVSEGTYQSAFSGAHKVWIVAVTDEISGNSSSTYYIDQQTRQLWQQEIKTGSKIMLMQRNEQ